MGFTFYKKLPVPKEIKEQYPLSAFAVKCKQNRDAQIRDIFTGKSDKILLIIGPCSADSDTAVLEYATRLSRLQDETRDRLLLIPRVYTSKPRTSGDGYKGMLHQPDPNQVPDLIKGIIAVRKLHTKIIEETGLTTADELLYPENYWYLADVLSYVAIGARSVEDQQHRMTASGHDVPAGMKNPLGGDLHSMLNAVHAAQKPHEFIYRGWAVRTAGNPLAHSILRGEMDKHGNHVPNYQYDNLELLWDLYRDSDCINPAVIIDTNHSNSGKRFEKQPRILREVLHMRKENPAIGKLVKGFLIESYLESGCQKVGGGIYGKSITDPCLGWEETESMIRAIGDGAQ